MFLYFASFFALALAYGVALFWLNRNFPLGDRAEVLNRPEATCAFLDCTITVTTWNIGYAGLGRQSDFVTDGGKNWFPPSPRTVAHNLAGITDLLGKIPAEIFLLQEVSHQSPLSFWQPVRSKNVKAFGTRFALFRPDISTRLLPWPLKIVHGSLTLAPVKPSKFEVIKLPAEPVFLGGLIKRNYALLVTRFPARDAAGEWVIANLHLAAFDPQGETRFAQIDAVLKFARREFEKGNFVVLGGDWNLALTASDFPHTTIKRDLFWLFDLPREKLPEGWKPVFDAKTPTVRTNYQPYVEGENYTAIIDGFIVSPNVQANAVHTTDTGFEHTDHMPVTASFSTMAPQRLK